MFVYLSIHILYVFFSYYMLIIFSVIWIFFKGNKSCVIKFREESLFAGLLFLEFFTFAKKAKLSTPQNKVRMRYFFFGLRKAINKRNYLLIMKNGCLIFVVLFFCGGGWWEVDEGIM